MIGIKNLDQIRENLTFLQIGSYNKEEIKRVEIVGEYVYFNGVGDEF